MSASAPIPDISMRSSETSRCATSGLMHRSKKYDYSITSVAVICMINGTVMPSAFAVLRLMTRSNLVGA